MIRLVVLLVSLALAARAQLVSGNVVRFTDASGNIISAGDNVNNAIRVNMVAGAGAGGTSSSYGAAFPASGTAAGFNDGTNMQGARVFDIDTSGGTSYNLGVNLRRSASGTPVELIGQTTMANSLPVVLASDQTVIPVSQSGTWTVQPGNTANTTPWFVKTVPFNGCSGTTVQDISQADVATGAGSALTSADTCVKRIYVTNKSASAAVTVTIRDKQGSPFSYLEAFSIPPSSSIPIDFDMMKFVSGVQVIAGTATSLNARLIGVQ